MANEKHRARTKKNGSAAARKAGSFPVVGIGASAGGLEAFSDFLANLPEKTGMAFVFIQHLDPSHGSVLKEILSRTTKIPVSEVTDGMAVTPNHVYVIPANTSMIIKDRVLRLAARELTRGQHMPVDHFLESLASDVGDQAISVVMSGTASDGTRGCGAVKAAGGITFAQDEQSAKYGSMPRSAIAAGWIDFVLPPAGIAKELARIGRHPYLTESSSYAQRVPSVPAKDNSMQSLLSLVRDATGVDFAHYKQSTLQRRVSRRMVVLQLESLKDYLRYIKSNPDELDKLYQEILIHVTGFFRDPGSFDALTKRVFPAILQENRQRGPIRIWVPGCSTGEEVYSIAMCLLEHLWEVSRKSSSSIVSPKEIQFFATDISELALDRAREGLYSDAAVSGVSPERLKQFFLPVDGGYQINKSLREMCIFAKQNVTSDPPFSNLDLVSCRNLLIYLGPHLQQRVIPIFHYALKPSGFLMLGGSESLGEFGDYFNLIDKRHKIYRKKQTAARLLAHFSGPEYVRRKPDEGHSKLPPELTTDKEIERLLMNRFVPPSIVVNNEMEIIQIRGKVGDFLEPAAGRPTFSLSKMAREGLLVDVRAALTQAKKQNTAIRKEGVRIQTNGNTREVDLDVVPIRGRSSADQCYLIVFHEPSSSVSAKGREGKARPESRSGHEKRLNREVVQLREQLQSLIEDHETTLEEFKTANEEVLSSNEELQSTNEELETAKEELQSSNEELITLNEELQNRNSELAVSNNDLSNLLGNANIPVLMIGNDLRIRRFTPQAQELLNLIPADIGRRFGQIKPNLDSEQDIEQIVRETIDSAILQEREVHQTGGRWYLMRVRPYKTWDNKIDGAVISFQDVDALKHRAEVNRQFADAVIENAREPTVVLDDALRISSTNRTFCEMFDVSSEEVENRSIFEIGQRQWDNSAIRDSVSSVVKRGARVDDVEVRFELPRLGSRTFLVNARRITLEENRQLVLISAEDITVKKQSLEMLRRHLLLLELAHETIIVRNLEGKILLWNRGAEELYGWNKQEALGKSVSELLETKFPKPWTEIEQELLKTERWQGELTQKIRDGSHKVVSSRWAVLKEDGGVPVILEINSDISKQIQGERELRQLSGRLLRLQDEERRRIAREIHDSTGQRLAALKMNLDALNGDSKSKTESNLLMSESIAMVEDIIRETRTLSQILHPPDLDTLGLLAAIRSLAKGFSLRSGIPVQVDGPASFQRMPGDMEIALYRVAQESLTNIHRHSGATKASIQINQTPQHVTLTIRDNGKGMADGGDGDHTGDGSQVMGVGVLGMKERLAQLQGNLEITSGKDGTAVDATVPVRAATAGKTPS